MAIKESKIESYYEIADVLMDLVRGNLEKLKESKSEDEEIKLINNIYQYYGKFKLIDLMRREELITTEQAVNLLALLVLYKR